MEERMEWVSLAYAMGTAGQGTGGQQGSGFQAFIPLVLMVGIFYFLLNICKNITDLF